jgi:hypothetical protein
VEEVLIFANPIAGRGRGKSIARRLEARLRADGFAVRLLLKKPDLLEREDLGDSKPSRRAARRTQASSGEWPAAPDARPESLGLFSGHHGIDLLDPSGRPGEEARPGRRGPRFVRQSISAGQGGQARTANRTRRRTKR